LHCNVKLEYRNTLGFNSIAQLSVNVTDEIQLPSIISFARKNDLHWQVLGGGSNIILPSVISGLTLLMDIESTIIRVKNDGKVTLIEVGAGNSWHEFVRWTVQNKYPGLENLALIPGTVGGAPVQNIGAYGIEVQSYIHAVKTYDTVNNRFVVLSTCQCEFSYRSSIFKCRKSSSSKQYIITHVVFAFPDPILWRPRITYPDLRVYFTSFCPMDESAITPLHVFDAVCAIRRRKLPDPNILGNVGSFFHNPTINHLHMEVLQERYPGIISYPIQSTDKNNNSNNGIYKLAAGWLIDQCGFKGLRKGRVGVHSEHALVLVHFPTEKQTITTEEEDEKKDVAQELLNLASEIQAEVMQRFEVALQIEPTIFPSANSKLMTNVEYNSLSYSP